MKEQQPEALRHSEWLESLHTTKASKTAAELRRLHEVNAELLEFAKEWLDRQGTDENYMVAKARTAITKAEAAK